MIGLLVLIAATTFAGFQWIAMRESNRITRISAEAARGANEIARQALKLSQGPNIYLAKSVLTRLTAGEKIRLELEFRNAGHSSGNDFAVGTFIDIRVGDPASLVNFEEPKIKGDFPPETTQSIIVSSPVAVTADQVRQIEDSSLTVYVYGVIQTSNPFEPGVIEDTVFCSRYDPSREDRTLGPCSFAPALSLNGKPLNRTTDVQKHP